MRTKVGLALNEGYIFGSGGEGLRGLILPAQILLKTACKKLERLSGAVAGASISSSCSDQQWVQGRYNSGRIYGSFLF